MKTEVYRRQADDTREEMFARILDAAARIEKSKNQLQEHAIFSRRLQSALNLMVGRSNIYCELYRLCHYNIKSILK
jgi:hypothetical protein